MQRNWKYVLPLAVTSLGLFTSSLQADASDSAQMRNLENRVNALEQRKGAGGMINPQGRPQVRDGADLFVFADLLYWNAHQNGMNVALRQSNISTTNQTRQELNNANVESIRGKWNWGFRTGLGYNAMHDGWDVKLTWLRFTDTGHKRLHARTDSGYYPSQIVSSVSSPVQEEGFATSAKGYWGFNLNQIDLEMGREFFVSKWLTIRPHLGLRTDWIHQNFDNQYRNLGTNSANAINTYDTLAKDHWYGIGLAGGLDTQWGLGNGWSIFGNAAASIIYGLHQIHLENLYATTAGDTVETAVQARNCYRVSHPVLDLAMGIRWDYMFSKDRFHLGFDLGWEHHIYFSQNQLPTMGSAVNPGTLVSNQGDLSLQGWTFSARFDF